MEREHWSEIGYHPHISEYVNPLCVNPTKWSNTLKQFVAKSPTNCLTVLDHFVGLALEKLKFSTAATSGVFIVNFEHNAHNILYINIAFITECLFTSKGLLPE